VVDAVLIKQVCGREFPSKRELTGISAKRPPSKSNPLPVSERCQALRGKIPVRPKTGKSDGQIGNSLLLSDEG
jgi:hypothetical protein